MPFQLTNKSALVTGAGSGIGAAIAETFARAGAHVFVTDINLAAATETAGRIAEAGGSSAPLTLDVRDERACEAIAARTGTVEIPPDATGPPLCVADNDAYPRYTQGQADLDVGDIMLMYTDGLIERRGEDLYEGIARLACQLEAWRPGPPLDDLCDRLVGSLATQPQQDDMCVLAVCRT